LIREAAFEKERPEYCRSNAGGDLDFAGHI